MGAVLAIFVIILVCLGTWLSIRIRLQPVAETQIEDDALMVGAQTQWLSANDNRPVAPSVKNAARSS
jgi:hypothetical protein